MKHNLRTLYEWIVKHNPIISDPFLERYCVEGEKINKETSYFYGYNSLKWLIFSLRDEYDNRQLQKLFFSIATEYIAARKSPESIQFEILNYYGTVELKSKLKQKKSTDLSNVETIQIGRWKVAINESENNLTNLIMRNMQPDILVFRNQEKQAAGIALKTNGEIHINHQNAMKNIFNRLSEIEPGWTALTDQKGINLLINHGLPAGKSSSISVDELLSVINVNIENL